MSAIALFSIALVLATIAGCGNSTASQSGSSESEGESVPADNNDGKVEYSWSGLSFYLDKAYGNGWGKNADRHIMDLGSGLSALTYRDSKLPITEEDIESVKDACGSSMVSALDLEDLTFHVFIYKNGETQSPEHYDQVSPMPTFSGFDEKVSLANDCTTIASREDGAITYTFFEENVGTTFFVMGHDADSGYGFVLRIDHMPYSHESEDLEIEFLRPVAEEVYSSAVFDPAKVTFDSLAKTTTEASPNDNDNQISSQGQTPAYDKDELIVDADGKMVYRVQAVDSTIHFTGAYTGSGNFIVKVLDDNQQLDTLVCNEIGDWKLDSSAKVNKGSYYYISIECSDGTWTASWTGTGGQ